MEISALCTVIATLTVLPNRSQFFKYDPVSLSCGQQGNSSEWRVRRNTSINIDENCPWNKNNQTDCIFDHIYTFDSGVYWCESAEGKCSDTVNITVTGGSVILESPVLPVMEGDDVTLSCRGRDGSSSNLTTDFSKDEVFIRSSSTGNMTLHRVSRSDEGLYRCNISGAGGSPGSWLTVRVRPAERPQLLPLTCVLLPVFGVCLLLVMLMLLFLWRHHKGKADLSYTDVIITPAAQPQTIRDQVDAAPTFYSTVRPGFT